MSVELASFGIGYQQRLESAFAMSQRKLNFVQMCFVESSEKEWYLSTV